MGKNLFSNSQIKVSWVPTKSHQNHELVAYMNMKKWGEKLKGKSSETYLRNDFPPVIQQH
jgi:hypothetical protein